MEDSDKIPEIIKAIAPFVAAVPIVFVFYSRFRRVSLWRVGRVRGRYRHTRRDEWHHREEDKRFWRTSEIITAVFCIAFLAICYFFKIE